MKTKLVSLVELQQAREIAALKRQHALARAKKFYRVTDDVEGLDMLRKIVFGNWLDAHTNGTEFQPLEFIGA